MIMDERKPLANWMSELPVRSQNRPLTELCIPGSHDSFTYALDRRGPIGNDQPTWIQRICKLFPPIKRIVYNWSRCQSLSLAEQLENGVRYLDIRLTSQNGRICTVHGLLGEDLDRLLSDVDAFLRRHPKEVVLLDFNHFYNMEEEEHRLVIHRLLTVFGSRCCPGPPLGRSPSVDLRTCWLHGWQAIIFYQVPCFLMDCILSSIIANESESVHRPCLIWTSLYIQSPWANTDKIKVLMDFLECALNNREKILPRGGFFVTQGLLTPTTMDVIFRPLSTLRTKYGIPAVKEIVSWLLNRGPFYQEKLNIVITDFVDVEDFCAKVIAMNF